MCLEIYSKTEQTISVNLETNRWKIVISRVKSSSVRLLIKLVYVT